MAISILSFILYFSLGGLSILGLTITGIILSKKRGAVKNYEFPDQKNEVFYIFAIFCLFYIVAMSLEFLGHFVGIWTWTSLAFIPGHAAFWWGLCLTASLFTSSSLNKYERYIILLIWVLIFELLQEAFIGFVTHNPFIFRTPYITIIITMSLVCLTSFIALDIVKKLKLLK